MVTMILIVSVVVILGIIALGIVVALADLMSRWL